MIRPGSRPAGTLLVDRDAHLARDALLRKIMEQNDLPALGQAVSRVVHKTSSDGEAVGELAQLVLSDVGLTQKILRVSNTVFYRVAAGVPVTTISRAIFLLGFDTVKTIALAMLLVEGLTGRRRAALKAELNLALAASVMGRELARKGHHKDPEEAAVAALFNNIGRVLVAAHDHHLHERIGTLCKEGLNETQASTRVLGCSFDMLGRGVLSDWRMPDTILQTLTPLPPGILKPSRGRQEWLQQLAGFSAQASQLLHAPDGESLEAGCEQLLARFGPALHLTREDLDKLLAQAAEETGVLLQHAGAGSAPTTPATQEASGLPLLLPGEAVSSDDADAASDTHPSGKPLQSFPMLLAGVQDLTALIAGGRSHWNEVLLMALEVLQRSLGFRFATVCLFDTRQKRYRARLAMGEHGDWRAEGFHFSPNASQDLFQLAMANNADLMISDARVEKIQSLIPAWHRQCLPDARSFIVLPLVVGEKRLGFFYADRHCAAPEGISREEAALIRSLKGQVLGGLRPPD